MIFSLCRVSRRVKAFWLNLQLQVGPIVKLPTDLLRVPFSSSLRSLTEVLHNNIKGILAASSILITTFEPDGPADSALLTCCLPSSYPYSVLKRGLQVIVSKALEKSR